MSTAGDEGLPEADRLEGRPHPRETTALIGQGEAEAALLGAYRSGRMHHAWILAGPEGVGKATLAYRLARFVLAHPDPAAGEVQAAADLAIDPAHPAARRVARQSHPDLFVLRRGWNADRKAIYQEIRVDDVRRAIGFFSTTSAEGGWRVCLVDTADDMNINGANALLKVLEEPPPRTLFLLLSVAPRRLLPTIRSRCRMLAVGALSDREVAEALSLIAPGYDDAKAIERAAAASEGSVRRAALLLEGEALEARDSLMALLDTLPTPDPRRLHALAESVAGRDGPARFAALVEGVLDWLHGRARAGAVSGDPRLARWAELWDKTARAAREAEIYNLDRRPLVLAIMSDLAEAARG